MRSLPCQFFGTKKARLRLLNSTIADQITLLCPSDTQIMANPPWGMVWFGKNLSRNPCIKITLYTDKVFLMITPALYYGLDAQGNFYSSDDQAGRASLVIDMLQAAPQVLAPMCEALHKKQAELQRHHTDVILLVSGRGGESFAQSVQGEAGDLYAGIRILVCPDQAVTLPGNDRQDSIVSVVSRALDVVYATAVTAEEDAIAQAVGAAKQLNVRHNKDVPVPVLLSPLLFGQDFFRMLIEKFENSVHTTGGMASTDTDGKPLFRIDRTKKHRSDFLLPQNSPLAQAITDVLTVRCVPEIKKAFQFEATCIDRILIARYDETGGYFRRHRDNNAPQTAFRKFALSVNLNEEFEGGSLFFPEYNDHHFTPDTGNGIIFSASALHEVSPVTQGQRYCLLTFFA